MRTINTLYYKVLKATLELSLFIYIRQRMIRVDVFIAMPDSNKAENKVLVLYTYGYYYIDTASRLYTLSLR